MAAALQSFRFAVRSCNCRHIAPRHVAKSVGRGREFSTTPQQWSVLPVDEIDARDARIADEVQDRLLKMDETSLSRVQARELAEWKIAKRELDAEMEGHEAYMKMLKEEVKEKARASTQPFVLPLRRKKLKQTFMNMGEPEPWEEEGMLQDDHDDITSLAHGELEQHREMRHYARLAAWEMPLLSSRWYPFGSEVGVFSRWLLNIICRTG
jgi:small subunit ribosomal protein S35